MQNRIKLGSIKNCSALIQLRMWLLYRYTILLLSVWLTFCCFASAADRLVLRSLKVISDRQVRSFDEDGMILDDQRMLGWDEIEKGLVSEKQAEFDQLRNEIGEPLFRIRLRLKVGDVSGAGEPAETLYPRFLGRQSDSAALVHLATMWSRLAKGQRENALAPFVHFLESVRKRKPGSLIFPGERQPRVDLSSGLSGDLLPIWFDAAEAKRVLPEVMKAISTMSLPRPDGVRIYYASLALAANDVESAKKAVSGIGNQNEAILELRDLILVQEEIRTGNLESAIAKLQILEGKSSQENRILVGYLLGETQLQSSSETLRQAGLLRLLKLSALGATASPDIAAAGLYEAMLDYEKRNEARNAISLRRELLQNFPQTYHGRLLSREK